MAATAKKGHSAYAQSRVYSYSRTATAEKLPYEDDENIPAQIPRVERKRHAAPQTRIIRETTPAQKRKQRTVPKIVSIAGVATIAAIMILLVLRYAQIATAYSNINSIKEDIEESRRKITELEVQLDEAVSIEEARLAAARSGLNYPTADQIVTVNGAVGGYLNGTADTQTDTQAQNGETVPNKP